jgi:hypothetical protein
VVQEGALVEEVIPSGESRCNGAVALSGCLCAGESKGGADDDWVGGLSGEESLA